MCVCVIVAGVFQELERVHLGRAAASTKIYRTARQNPIGGCGEGWLAVLCGWPFYM